MGVHDTRADSLRPYHKPQGLWLSLGNAWLDWCVRNQFGLARLKWATPVELAPDANILFLPTTDSLRWFSREYAAPQRYPDEAVFERRIDWPSVSRQHDGILIPRHDFSDLDWYSSWDVASACVWRARAVRCVGHSREIEDGELTQAAI